MKFLGELFGGKEKPKPSAQEQSSARPVDLNPADHGGVIEYNEPETEGLGPIVNEGNERPRQNESQEAPAGEATSVRYEGGIDLPSAENQGAEVAKATDAGVWEDVGTRTPGEIRAEKRADEDREAA